MPAAPCWERTLAARVRDSVGATSRLAGGSTLGGFSVCGEQAPGISADRTNRMARKIQRSGWIPDLPDQLFALSQELLAKLDPLR